MRLTKEEKIKYVKAYNAGEIINTPEGFTNRNAFKSSLLNWVKRYNSEGEKGLERRPQKIVANAEKIAIVERIHKGERNIDIARETGFSSGAITNWCRNYSILLENQVECNAKEESTMPEIEKTRNTDTAESKIKQLEAENEQLKAENAVLKKSVTLKVMKARQQKRRKSSGNCCQTVKADTD